MNTEMRAFRTHAPLPAPWGDLVASLARALGISLEIWTPASHHGQRLVLGPACERCEREDSRTFDRCRKRRAYLTRPEVQLPERLAERCPRRVRLCRRGTAADAARALVFAFGYGADDPAGESDAGIASFLGGVRALMLPGGPLAEPAAAADERSETGMLFEMACGREARSDTHTGAKPTLSGAMELVAAVVAACEGRRAAQRGHARRVRLLALLIGREVGLDPPTLDALQWAALLHGIAALAAPGPDDGEACALDAAGGPPEPERRARTHGLLAGLAGFDGVCTILQHHRTPAVAPASSGPPELARAAACLAVADALDILLAQQERRRPRTLQTAIGALASATSSRFDPQAIQALQRLEPLLRRHTWIFLLHRHGTV